MNLIFYGNIIEKDIESKEEATARKRELIDLFLQAILEIREMLQKMDLPREVIKDFPQTLEEGSELYQKMELVKGFFGEKLVRIDYIPVSKELELIFAEKESPGVFLSNVGLEIACGIGDIQITE